MPIYAYKCESCGHAKDVLQKMSDAPLVDCPVCGVPAFKKQLTAAGFQLKGSGWYVTDFRDGKGGSEGGSNSGADKAKEGESSKESGSSEKADTSASSGSDTGATVAKTSAAAPAPAPVAASSPPPSKAAP